MKCVIIKIAHDPKYPHNVEYPGWVVPDTEDTLAVDLRIPGSVEHLEPNAYFITHLPTGYRVHRADYTDATSREDAVAMAQRFYRGAVAIGMDLKSSDPNAIVGPHNKMTADEKLAFWRAVREEPKEPASDQEALPLPLDSSDNSDGPRNA